MNREGYIFYCTTIRHGQRTRRGHRITRLCPMMIVESLPLEPQWTLRIRSTPNPDFPHVYVTSLLINMYVYILRVLTYLQSSLNRTKISTHSFNAKTHPNKYVFKDFLTHNRCTKFLSVLSIFFLFYFFFYEGFF